MCVPAAEYDLADQRLTRRQSTNGLVIARATTVSSLVRRQCHRLCNDSHDNSVWGDNARAQHGEGDTHAACDATDAYTSLCTPIRRNMDLLKLRGAHLEVAALLCGKLAAR